MTVEEYVAMRKKELDLFASSWNESLASNAEGYDKHNNEEDWVEQEDAYNELAPKLSDTSFC